MFAKLLIARTTDNVIGYEYCGDYGMLWNIPSDLQHFKRESMDTTVVIGHNTWKSFGGRPLPGRPHVVITKDPKFTQSLYKENSSVRYMTFEQFVEMYKETETVFTIAGGSMIYKSFLSNGLVDQCIVTDVYSNLTDLSFPLDTKNQPDELSKLHVIKIRELDQFIKMDFEEVACTEFIREERDQFRYKIVRYNKV